MTSGLRRSLVALAAAGLLAGTVPLAAALADQLTHNRVLIGILGPLVTWGFVGAGLYAWLRQPANRVGLLLSAVGFTWCASTLVVLDVPAAFLVGFIATPLTYVLLMHTLLAFPDGRLHSTLERVLVSTGYFSAIVLQFVVTLFFETAGEPQGFAPNPVLVADEPGLVDALGRGRSALGTLLITAMAIILLRRWRAAGSQRRALTPVLLTGSVVASLLVLWLVARVAGLSGFQDGLEVARVAVLAIVPFAYLAGLLHSRVAGATAVSELVSRLREGPGGSGDIRAALAQALDDPTVELAYWLPERAAYVDAQGNPIELPDPGSSRTSTAVESKGRPVAAIVHDSSLTDQGQLVRAAGAAASLVLENERLQAELRAKLSELRASRARLVDSEDEARRRLERDLHDGAQQRLVSASLSLRMLDARLERDPEAAQQELRSARRELEAALEELRELARGLHPAVLTERGLGPALQGIANRAPLPVEVTEVPDRRLPDRVEVATFFLISEGLTNVAKYAEANRASVSVRTQNGNAVVEVRDDGVGGADPSRGSGLRGLADRIAALDGQLEVDSPSGAGTTVRARIPCG